jgi:GTPase SAR1 family protein
MEYDINRLISIAKDSNMLKEEAQLAMIQQRLSDTNCELILPLVGEFSAGKTTLINSLTDSKKLETATKPTTKTIYEIHFGCDSCYAEVFDENGIKREIYDLSSLKNDELSDSTVVNIFDTSTQVPSGIILVDTPGLSSSDPRHKQTLVDFLPQADGILLVVDVNAQLTRSLTEFVDSMKLARRPVFLVITQCAAKPTSEIERVRKYIAENCNLSLNMVACVSAKEGDLSQLCDLLAAVQQEKGRILTEVNTHRIKEIVRRMISGMDELLKASSSDEKLEEAIRAKERELRQIDRNIEKIVSDAQDDIEDEQRSVTRMFQENVSARLDSIVAGKSENFNVEAVTAINSTASICLSEFKNKVTTVVQRKTAELERSDDNSNFQSFGGIDMSSLSVSGLSFNLDLDSIGHQYDGMISTGVKVAAAAAAVVAVVATAGTAAGAAGAAGTAAESGAVVTAAGTASTAAEVGGVIEAVDIATDIGSIVSNNNHISRVQQMMNYAGKASEEYGNIERLNETAGQQMGQKKGMVESMVGFVTDKTWGKPQRRRAISIYVDQTLMPQFRLAMDSNRQMVLNSLSDSLRIMAQLSIEEKRGNLEKLRSQHREHKDAFEKRLAQIREYKNELLTL